MMGIPSKKCYFQLQQSRVKGMVWLPPAPWMPINLCTALTHAHRAVERKWPRVESGSVCETADGQASFKNDALKHFGFLRNKKEEKDEQTKNIMKTLPSALFCTYPKFHHSLSSHYLSFFFFNIAINIIIWTFY